VECSKKEYEEYQKWKDKQKTQTGKFEISGFEK